MDNSLADDVLENLDDPDADIILCSREHHEFRVLKLYITKVSPVLRDLIQSASSSHTSDATLSFPSVQLFDSNATLYSLLTFILPMHPVLPSTLEQTMVLLSAAQKYQMDSILYIIRAVVGSQNPPFIRPETAFRVYSLARMHGLRQEALQAARTTLTFQFTIEDLEDELDAINSTHLHELWTYYQSVRTYLRTDLEAFRTTDMPVPTPCFNNTSHGTPVWLDAYVGSIAESPALFDLTDFHMCFSLHIGQNKECCSTMPGKSVRAFWTELTNVVHSCMTKAESTIFPLEEPRTALTPPACSKSVPPTPPLDHLDISDANIIIQSCDLVNFRVHKRMLSMSSPFFNDMFSLPQPQPSEKEVVDGLPVVQFSEDAEVLSGLITMLYPIPSLLPNSYDKALTLLATAQKYGMVGIQSRIHAEIQSREFPPPTGAEAFRSYAISSSGELSYERERLARLTLDYPMTFEYLCDELPSFKGWALQDLVGFRKRCRDNLVLCFESFLKFDQPPFNIWLPCSTHPHLASTGHSPPWLTQLFQKHLSELRNAFSKPLFNPQSIREEYLSALQAHVVSSSPCRCISCTKVHAVNGERFCKELSERLTHALSEVRLDLILHR